MYRFFARRLCLGLIAFGCGSPGDLDRDSFPDLQDTGYPDRVGAAGAGGTFGGSAGSSGVGGAGVGAGGTTGSGGTTPIAGTGGTLGGSAGGSNAQGGTGQAGAGQSGAGNQPGGACPDDITVLLNRPAMEGGCAGSGCHVAGGTPPDLTSPGVEARVLNMPASAACSARPYVGAADSVIEEKITSPDPSCGERMPFFAADRLNAADKACIVEWIDELSGGM